MTPNKDPHAPSIVQRLRALLALPVVSQFLRFLMVGGTATIVHTGVLYLLVQFGHLKPFLATSIGFCCGVTVSYILNSHFTFKTGIALNFRFLRFLAVTGVGFLLNSVIFTTLHNAGVMYLLAQLTATAIVVFWNFFGSRLLVFFGHSQDKGSKPQP
jgi:putative flippase GtrA